MLRGSYRYDENWIFSASLPYLDAVRRERNAPRNSIQGIGDASVRALYLPWAGLSSDLSGLGFTAGLILPTGEARDQPQVGVALPSVFQLGTGTTQLTLGVNYRNKINEWTFSGSLDGTFALDESSKGFRPAETFFLSVGAGRQVVEKVRAKLSLDLFHGEKDEFQGIEIANTGSTNLSITPSLIYQVNDDFALSGSVAIPLYREVNETALTIGPLWSLGLSYSF